jgi:ubiquinone/menaquinone biosynthesis C-methylase UbiE
VQVLRVGRRWLARRAARGFGWLAERLYYELAWAYDAVAWLVSLGRWSQWRREALSFVADGRVLEVGFGTGELLLEMRRRGLPAIGVDLSPAMLRLTRHKARRRHLIAPTVRADARVLPFADATFASVVATFPAAYVLSPALMAEVRRVLLPGGCFVVAGLYVQSRSPFLKVLAWLVNGGDVAPALSRFEAAAAGAGLSVTRVDRSGRGFVLPVFLLRAETMAEAQLVPGPGGGDE